MSVPLRPLPDHDVLKTGEVAAALGIKLRQVETHLQRGRFPGAFRTPGMGRAPGRWRVPRAAVVEAGREMGLWDEPSPQTRQQLVDDLPPDSRPGPVVVVRAAP